MTFLKKAVYRSSCVLAAALIVGGVRILLMTLQRPRMTSETSGNFTYFPCLRTTCRHRNHRDAGDMCGEALLMGYAWTNLEVICFGT